MRIVGVVLSLIVATFGPVMVVLGAMKETSNERTAAYACGYRAGQVAILSRLPSGFHGTITDETADCAVHRAAAAKGGFSMGTP